MEILPGPEVSVVVASHDRPLRLLWLLNALERQVVAAGTFEVVVAHDSTDDETEGVLRTHPLETAGVLRHLTFPPDSQSPSAKRNAAYRATTAPLVAFTDDDCEPAPTWVGALLAASREHPDAVLQGPTRPDPDAAHLLQLVRHARSQSVDPPNWYAQTCNIAYPRDLLERLDGFDELGPVPAGEDTDLFLRARDGLGATLVAVPDALVHHAVEPMGLRRKLRFTRRWEHLAAVVKRHPQVRDHLYLRIFWRRRHALFLLGLLGLAAVPWRRSAALATVPWLRDVAPARRPRRFAGQLRRAPEAAAIDAVEIVTLARGSIRYRTLYL